MQELGILDLMLPAFCECLVLVGIHSYLGLHVIRRKVIFVDLALAQVAALGTTVGFLFGMAPDSIAAIIFSMLFTFIAAAVFAMARIRSERVPQEAIIGLVYAIAAAMIILVIDRAPHGAEHIKEVMTGAILWVKWESILFAAVAYSFIGVIHYIFRKQFLLISSAPEKAYESGMSVRLWDFLFYITFGVVISISVRTAGVLLVFVFLVVPAITATLITDRLKHQLLIGWAMGVLVTVIGLWLSYAADVPSGPMVVTFYGVMLVLAAVGIYLAHHRNLAGFLRVLAGVGVVAVTVGLVVGGGTLLGASDLARSRSHQHAEADIEDHIEHGHDEHGHGEAHGGDHHHGGGRAAREADDGAAEPADEVAALLSAIGDADGEQQDALVDALGEGSGDVLTRAFAAAEDDMINLTIARQMARRHGAQQGGRLALALLRDAELLFVKAETAALLDQLAERRFGYDPEGSDEQNAAALAAMDQWLGGL
jgi:zinc/manganese transport system permease protein